MGKRVLVCDDEELIRWSVKEHLQKDGFDVLTAEDGQAGLELVAENPPDAMILDLKMPRMGGLEVLQAIRDAEHNFVVIVITAHGGIESAIEATRLGADGYLQKPFDLREVSLQLERALEKRRLQTEVHYLRTDKSERYASIVGQSAAMIPVFDTLRKLERVDAPTVLITGESGTGKDLVAQAIHQRGPRRDRPFMEVDCTSLPPTLIESALFGHEKGSFTDAKMQKQGLFEVAKDGVVFLDEIGELPLEVQAKLLRALENRRFKRVGGVRDISIDAAMIAATNRDLKKAVEEGRFREDLFYRLNVIPIEIPPLRLRSSDIAPIVAAMIEKMNADFGRNVEGVTEEALECLMHYAWPGNVRELRNVVERAVILNVDASIIDIGHLPPEIVKAVGSDSAVSEDCPFELPDGGINLEAVERGLLMQALEKAQNNQSQAARLLGITRYALRYRMQKHGMMPNKKGGTDAAA